MVDSTASHERMSFLDAYAVYDQIKIHKEDEEHTGFIILRGLFDYTIMPSGLKNAGATFQRIVTVLFKNLLGTITEACADDLIFKSFDKNDPVAHLQLDFDIL